MPWRVTSPQPALKKVDMAVAVGGVRAPLADGHKDNDANDDITTMIMKSIKI